ncbi:MAG: hypothetical protein IJ586_03880, partial [Alloprevotella sp.]|nr:hypothetical protein [Alloprevotella sp.]
ISGDAFEFEAVEEMVANTPYLVRLNGTSLFKNTAIGSVLSCAASDVLATGAAEVSQLGYYTETPISSDATTTWYGYAGGQFVKANTGTIKPYRTAFAVDGQSSARAYNMSFAETGISTTTLNVDNAPAYDLQGRRVEKAQHGTFIIGGQKVILK